MTSSLPGLRRLLTASTAVLGLLLLVLGPMAMHSVMGQGTLERGGMAMTTTGHTHAGTAMDMTVHPHAGTPMDMAAHSHAGTAIPASDHPTAAVSHPDAPAMPAMPMGCDGLCGLLCSHTGMACLIVIVLFGWALLGPRPGGLLYLLARLVALASQVPRRVAVPRPPSLTALQIIRI
ncbi:hypothetical protein [Curtobacterium sp. ISL-83]|uniref:hypothetical protein n=1 Tax=Curtobacterium sp. ISL-83 TaxID=2819145 RepID=UPI001BEB4F6E|nr:hypothetical protein [Curtobacterium sp. ISL-83]MBT2502124.1 hypothetical protein [Curtobacterium sp. ISL-83]